jgi:hypothetical protein
VRPESGTRKVGLAPSPSCCVFLDVGAEGLAPVTSRGRGSLVKCLRQVPTNRASSNGSARSALEADSGTGRGSGLQIVSGAEPPEGPERNIPEREGEQQPHRYSEDDRRTHAKTSNIAHRPRRGMRERQPRQPSAKAVPMGTAMTIVQQASSMLWKSAARSTGSYTIDS